MSLTRVMMTFLVKRDGHRAPRLIWTNGTGWVLTVLFALIFTSACNQSSLAPTPVAGSLKNGAYADSFALTATMQPICAPTAHNIPVSFEGQETGPIYYVCATQPR